MPADNDIEGISLQFDHLCSADDFTPENGFDLFSFIFGALWSWKPNKNIKKVEEILHAVKKDNSRDFHDSGIQSIKARTQLLCGKNTLREFVTLIIRLKRPESSVREHLLRRQKAKGQHHPAEIDTVDTRLGKKVLVAQENLHKFWQRWFSLFESADIYRDFEKKILSDPDNPSQVQGARDSAARMDGILSSYGIDKKQRHLAHFRNIYFTTQRIFCYNRTLFFDCDTGRAKLYSPMSSCPFRKNQHEKIEELQAFYGTDNFNAIKTDSKSMKETSSDREKSEKKGREDEKKELMKKRDDAIQYITQNALPGNSGISGISSASSFGAVRKTALKRLGRRGVRFVDGSFVNRFGQPITANLAYRHYSI